jgi:hypothetical protein
LNDTITIKIKQAKNKRSLERHHKHQIERLLQGEKIDPPEEEPEDIEIKTDSILFLFVC